MSGDELDEADVLGLSGEHFIEHPEVRLDAADITRRARDAYGPDGRPALPPQTRWPIFPFGSDGLRCRPVEDVVRPEPPRSGELAEDCGTCKEGDETYAWTDERWRISMPGWWC